MDGRLIGIAHSGELLNFAGQSLLVHSLYVTLDANFQRCSNVDFDKALRLRANFVANCSIGRDRCRDGHCTMFAQERTDKSYSTDVFIAIFLTEAKPFGEVGADHVAI